MVNHLASKGGIFMRLIHCFLTKDEFSNKLNKARSFLTSASIPLSISDRGIYHNSRGTEISNFFIFPLSVSFKYNTNGHKMADVINLNCSITASVSDLQYLLVKLAIING